jgi:hypothetical protein
MKTIFEVNSRTTLKESAEEKHIKTVNLLNSLPHPWGISKDIDIPFPGFGKEFIASATLSKFLGNGIKMSVFYRYRNRLEDDDSCDDRMFIEFNSNKIDYSDLVTTIFRKFVIGFNAYTADIFN